MFVWMSSSSVRYGKVPAASSSRTAARPRTIASRSAADSSPARASALAHATLPAISCGQSRRSKAIDPVNRSAAGSALVVNRPP